MTALLLTLFVGLVLAGAAIAGFVFAVRQGDHEHADRLALLPLLDDEHLRQVDDQRIIKSNEDLP